MPRLELRHYQQAAIDGLYDYWADRRGDNPLIIAPTGSGKSLIIAKLIEDAMSFVGTRVLILAHVKELLEQNARELHQNLPGADFGFYSASLGQKRLDKPITFAGIQSVWQKAYDFIPAPDLVLVDEAHLVPKNTTTRYGKFLDDLKICNPDVKIIGLTATPYRLDSGYLHKGEGALFDGIAYDIPIGQLMDEGYLCSVISKGGLNRIDLSNVHLRGGEFIESELATAASDPELVNATVAEIIALAGDRKSWLIFSCGVKHAAMLEDAFKAQGISTAVVTGDTPNRDVILSAFKAGQMQCLINVNVLTTGFNAPNVDLIALVRATNSAGLYVQMVGRGTRNAPDKGNCLVLDFGQNVERHGFIDQIKPVKKPGEGGGEAPVKTCPECQALNPTAVRACIECGYEFPPPVLNHGTSSYGGAMLSTQVVAEWLDVKSVSYALHKKEGKPDSVRVSYFCGLSNVDEWLCPDHGGYATARYKARMKVLGATAMTTKDAVMEAGLIWTIPDRIKVRPRPDNPKFNEIVQLDYAGGRKPKGPGQDISFDENDEGQDQYAYDDENSF